MSVRKQLRAVYAELDEASSYEHWLEAARAHDALTGAEAWRSGDDSPFFDAWELRKAMRRWRSLRDAGDALGLAEALTQDLYRHLNDIATPQLYDGAMAGPQHIVDDFLDGAEASLRWLGDVEIPGVSADDKRRRFTTAYRVFGRSALMLSGGATLGFHHLGVVKALFDQGLLPHILSGASTGAMIAAGIGTRNDEEIADLFANTDQIRLDGLKPAGVRRSLRQRAWLDPEQLYAVLRNNVGERTFAEAWAHSGRAVNISVSPSRHRQKPRLLCHLTSPDVLVARAALASSALPGLFPPVVLEARTRNGAIEPYVPSERWVDGSLYEDLPKLRLSRLHNVNHFIVSQTNPHVVPFVRHHGRRGVRPAVAGLVTASLRTQGAFTVDVARRLVRPLAGLGMVADQAHALLNQDYRGDIDIHPQFHFGLYRKVVSNPTRSDLAAFIREGERSVWPKIAMIRNQTRIGRAFRAIVLQPENRG